MLPRVEEVASRSLPLVGADQSLQAAARVMLDNKTLGVITADVHRKPVMVLTYRRLVKVLAEGAHLQARVGDHGVLNPVVVWRGSSVAEALRLMREHSVRFLPVVDESQRVVGVFEPYHAAASLWELLDYGSAMLEARARKVVTLPGDATIRTAAKAMDANGVPEVLVRVGDELRILREQDFLRAVAEGRVDEGTVAEYAGGRVIMVPITFDAKAAVEVMLENEVRRLLSRVEGQLLTVTLSDLAFAAADMLAGKKPLETAFVLIKTEPGAELRVAEDAILLEGVREVYTVTGEADVLAIVEAPSIREIYRIVREGLRTRQGVLETRTMLGVRVARKKPD